MNESEGKQMLHLISRFKATLIRETVEVQCYVVAVLAKNLAERYPTIWGDAMHKVNQTYSYKGGIHAEDTREAGTTPARAEVPGVQSGGDQSRGRGIFTDEG